MDECFLVKYDRGPITTIYSFPNLKNFSNIEDSLWKYLKKWNSEYILTAGDFRKSPRFYDIQGIFTHKSPRICDFGRRKNIFKKSAFGRICHSFPSKFWVNFYLPLRKGNFKKITLTRWWFLWNYPAKKVISLKLPNEFSCKFSVKWRSNHPCPFGIRAQANHSLPSFYLIFSPD